MGRTTTIIAAGLSLLLAGCGSDAASGSSTPTACIEGADAYLDALAGAPDEVIVGDTTPLGDCLPREQPASKIADVGEGLVAAATELNRQALRDPLGDATLQLGYLVGVVQARAEQTGGIHEDLALRVESEALFIPRRKALPGGFQQRYEEGLAAGRESTE